MHIGNQLKPQNYDINNTNFCTKTSEDFEPQTAGFETPGQCCKNTIFKHTITAKLT